MGRRWMAAALAAVLAGAAGPDGPPATEAVSRMDVPWWRARLEAKRRELADARPSILWLGDSITQHLEDQSPTPWKDFRPVWDGLYASRGAVNLGFSGDGTENLLWRLRHGEADGVAPRLAIVLIGANDLGRLRRDAPGTLRGVEDVVAEVRARLPATRVLIVGILPSILEPRTDAEVASVNAGLAARYAGGTEATFVDASNALLRDGRPDPADFMDPRGDPPGPALHPTAQAMLRVCDAIEPEVEALLR